MSGGGSGKGSGKLPARAHNPKRIARMAASWKRGQERKDARRLAQSKRERVNKALNSEGKLTKWEALTEAHRGTRNKLYNVGTAAYVMSAPVVKPAKGQMNPGRSVSIGATLNAKRVITGWAFACVNCRTRKAYSNEHFHDPEGAAIEAGRDHMCAPQSWKSPVKELALLNS
jgi:hypothetical protein